MVVDVKLGLKVHICAPVIQSLLKVVDSWCLYNGRWQSVSYIDDS